jgi:hypothetical protein
VWCGRGDLMPHPTNAARAAGLGTTTGPALNVHATVSVDSHRVRGYLVVDPALALRAGVDRVVTGSVGGPILGASVTAKTLGTTDLFHGVGSIPGQAGYRRVVRCLVRDTPSWSRRVLFSRVDGARDAVGTRAANIGVVVERPDSGRFSRLDRNATSEGLMKRCFCSAVRCLGLIPSCAGGLPNRGRSAFLTGRES